MTQARKLNVGSRESPLAIVQTRKVIDMLKAANPGLACEVITYKTTGDQFLEASLSEVGDKGLFVKELETALLKKETDIAVHSLKDMPSVLPRGLTMVAAGERNDPRDVLITLDQTTFDALPAGAVVGTASLRRVAQLKRKRDDLTYEVIRGNLQTRYQKLEKKQFDAIVLAAAGVHRLGWDDRISEYLDPNHHVPAVGQGILCVEYRGNDPATETLLNSIQDEATTTAMVAERAFLKKVEGGCKLPMAGYCWFDEDAGMYRMTAQILSPDGTQCVQGERRFHAANAENAGRDLAIDLLADGGKKILLRMGSGS